MKLCIVKASSSAALVALVAQNAALIILLNASFREGASTYAASTVVFSTELVKFTVCSSVLGPGNFGTVRTDGGHRSNWLFIVPSLLYVLQNNLLFFGASQLSSLVYIVCTQFKIVTAAFASRLFLSRTITWVQWISLTVLVLGIVMVQLRSNPRHYDQNRQHTQLPSEGLGRDPKRGFVAVMLASVTSGVAGVALEFIFKQQAVKRSVWQSNLYLSSVSLPIAFAMMLVQDSTQVLEGNFFEGYDSVVFAVIVLQAAGGVLIGFVLKYADNILKCFAVAVSICCCVFYSVMIGQLSLSTELVIGVMLVLFAVTLYSAPLARKSNERTQLLRCEKA
jgi:UDP-sugar transporter A1/2/3